MRYLYGDSTPFPLSENFLATLCAATDACVAILRADEQVDEVERLLVDADAKFEGETSEIADLERVLERTLGEPGRDFGVHRNHADAAFAAIAKHAWSTTKSAREEASRDRDASRVQASLLCPHAQVLPALSTFLSAHQIPDTSWGIRWAGGLDRAPSRSEIYARTPFGLAATFEVAIPEGHLFARPVQVAMLAKQSTIKLLRKPLLRKPRPTTLPLDDLYVTAVLLTQERATMSLRKSATKASAGLELSLHEDASVSVTRVDKKGYPTADEERLSPENAASARRIWTRIVATIGNLLEYRKRALSATFGGVPVSEVARPATIAESLIASIAPLVREIARKTGTTRELALKRVVADGCREELFISYDTVLERMRGLTPRTESFFEAFGLRTYAPTPALALAPAAISSMPPAPGGVVHRLPVVRPPRLRSGFPPAPGMPRDLATA